MTQIDYALLFWLQDHVVSAGLTPVMKAFTALGNGGVLWIVLCLLLLCFKKTRAAVAAGLVALICVHLLNNLLLKGLVARPRPFYGVDIDLLIAAPGGWSFPSGHASTGFAAATAIFLKDKRVGIPALAAAALIAFSRLYFFVHFPSDVCVGAIEGILAAVIIVKVGGAVKKRIRR